MSFSIDTNGIVHVTAKDLATERSQNITISGSGNMSREEIDRAVRDAEAYAAKAAREKQEKDRAAENGVRDDGAYDA